MGTVFELRVSERNATVQYVAYYLTLFGSYIKPKNRKEKQKQVCPGKMQCGGVGEA